MWKKTAKPSIILILLSVITLIVFFFTALEFRDRKLELFTTRIRKLEELVTVRQIYRNVIYTEIKENLIVDKRSLFSINYIVTAGVDFSEGINIDAEKTYIKVTYPYPSILSVDADESSIDEYFSLQRFSKLRQSDYLNILYDEKERIGKDALHGGILERADKNLQSLIRGILKEGGIHEVRFEYLKGAVAGEV